MKNRRDEIIRITGNVIPEQFSKSSAETVRYCEAHKEKLVSGFLEAFQTAVEQAGTCQAEGKKGKVKYILFSHLYSSMFLRKYEIQIGMMDERFYNDTSPAVSYWDAGAIYRLFEDDVETIKLEVEKKIYRIREYEADYIRYFYYPCYHRLARSFLQTALEAALQEEAFLPESICITGPVKVSFGEYMGKAEALFPPAEKEGES